MDLDAIISIYDDETNSIGGGIGNKVWAYINLGKRKKFFLNKRMREDSVSSIPI